MFSCAFSFLCLASAVTNAQAFVLSTTSSPSTALNSVNFVSAFSFAKKTYTVKSLADKVGKDKDGNVVRVPVKNIEREWSVGDFTSEGDFNVNLFVPEDGKVKGCAFFMHGFSQYPVAYRQTLADACEASGVAIIAVETGVTDKFVRKDADGKTGLQANLQRAVSEDTKQCIKMVLEGNDAFAEYGVTKRAVGNKIAVMGHSMGGGLSFPVSADSNVDYVFTMAPAFGEPEFNPIVEGVDKRTPKNSMLLAGGWDLVAPAKKVESISAAANSIKHDSSVYVDIARGLHTGFEDKLVLFSVPITSILKGAGLAGKILGFFDAGFFNIVQTIGKVISFGRTKTGQIDGSGALMEYFLCAMVAGKSLTTEAAEKYLDDNIADKFENKFVFSYAEKN